MTRPLLPRNQIAKGKYSFGAETWVFIFVIGRWVWPPRGCRRKGSRWTKCLYGSPAAHGGRRAGTAQICRAAREAPRRSRRPSPAPAPRSRPHPGRRAGSLLGAGTSVQTGLERANCPQTLQLSVQPGGSQRRGGPPAGDICHNWGQRRRSGCAVQRCFKRPARRETASHDEEGSSPK